MRDRHSNTEADAGSYDALRARPADERPSVDELPDGGHAPEPKPGEWGHGVDTSDPWQRDPEEG